MLQGTDSYSAKTSAQVLNHAGRQNKLITLRNQRNNWREHSSRNKEEHFRILQEGNNLHLQICMIMCVLIFISC